MSRATAIKRQILRQRGLTRVAQNPGAAIIYKKLRPVPTNLEHLKTPKMKMYELQFGKPIEELLLSNSIRQVAAMLQMHRGSVSKWRRRLNLDRTYALPDCSQCKVARTTCVSGICHILVDKSDWDAVDLKRQRLQERIDN